MGILGRLVENGVRFSNAHFHEAFDFRGRFPKSSFFGHLVITFW